MKLDKLNRQQRAAVKHHLGPILVVAGAGTGKTQVIIQRIAYLISHYQVKPSEILGVTFTEKAAQEMQTRVSESVGKYTLDVKITTFNALGYEVVRRFAYELGMDPNLQLLSDTQQLVFLRDHLDELGLEYYAPITNPEGMLADLASYFGQLGNELIDVKKYTKFAQDLVKTAKDAAEKLEAKRHMELARAYGVYQDLKRRANVIDFNDQVSLMVELLEKFPNVAQKLRAEIKYVLVDEFQDTNAAQSRLIDLLAGAEQNIMVVGDDDQSIYRFRGAAVANILQFLDRYPNATRIALNQNYRSSQQILDTAYGLIQHNNPDRLEAKYQLDKQLTGQFEGPTPVLKQFITYDEEAAYIADQIKAKLKAGRASGSIAILIRKNSQANILTRYLSAVGVEYHVVGQSENLYRQPEIKNLLNFFRVLSDPRDTESLYHLLVSDIYKVDPGQLRPLVTTAQRRHISLEAALNDEILTVGMTEEPSWRVALEQLAEFRRQLPELTVGQLGFSLLKQTGFLHRLIQAARNEPALDIKISNLNQFFVTLREFEAVAQDNSVVGYVAALPALMSRGEKLAIEDLPELFGQQVLILTVHKAKGLEFDTVYLFDISQDTFPSRRQISSLEVPHQLTTDSLVLSGNPHLLEERRLMYVAMTRAKQELVLTYSLDHGGRQAKRPSIFIEEALGPQPSLAKLKRPAASTSQIELFAAKPLAKRGQKFQLPSHLLRGDKLFLTQRQIDDYIKCPTEFYLRHIIMPPQPVSFALEYGNLMHNLLQFYNRRRLDGQPVTLTQLQEYLEAHWPLESFITTGHRARSLRQAKATLKRFWQREQAAKRRPAQIEQSFEFELAAAGVRVRGRYDAVYTGKVTEIRDYKTGATGVNSQAKAEQKAKASFQLGVYALAWQQIYGQPPQVLSLDFIDSGFIGQTTKSPRQLQTIEAKIARAANGIRAGDFRPGSSHLFCTHPQYGF